MRSKFSLINEKHQQVAIVLYFFEEQLNRYVGIIISMDLSQNDTWLYQTETIKEVITDLATRLKIHYHDYIEVE